MYVIFWRITTHCHRLSPRGLDERISWKGAVRGSELDSELRAKRKACVEGHTMLFEREGICSCFSARTWSRIGSTPRVEQKGVSSACLNDCPMRIYSSIKGRRKFFRLRPRCLFGISCLLTKRFPSRDRPTAHALTSFCDFLLSLLCILIRLPLSFVYAQQASQP